MTDPVETPPHAHPDPPAEGSRVETLPDPLATSQTVQQLRDAGFSDDEQAVLTAAFLRVLALWTQQATRDDLQTALHAGEQRLVQHLEILREALCRESAQHAEAMQEAVRSACAQQAKTLATTWAAPARRWDVPPWLLMTLLVLTCAGVFVLVAYRVLGW